MYTRSRTVGTHRLLIIDGYASHNSQDFQNLCSESKTIALYMPPHASHLLQPLNVGCYSPFKRAYGDEISDLARRNVTYISKTEFLTAFRAAHSRVFKGENILASFKGAMLVPLAPDAVLSKLNVKPRTPTPPAPETTLWEPKTPRTLCEVDSQSAFVLDKTPTPTGSSLSSLKEAVLQLTKGTIAMAHELVLLRAEVTDL